MEERRNRLEKDIKQVTVWCQAWPLMSGMCETCIMRPIFHARLYFAKCDGVNLAIGRLLAHHV